ncbi:MAG: dipeptidase [Terriglobales bacterium]
MPFRILLCCALLCLAVSAQNPPKNPAPDWRAIHQSAIIIDGHADTPQRFVDEGFDLGSDAGAGHMDLAKVRAGNLGAQFFSIWPDLERYRGHYPRRTLELIDSVYQQVARHPDRMMMAFTADDIVRAHQQHKLAALMGIEGGHAIDNSLGLLRDYYRLGVRYMTLTHYESTDWADSSGDIDDPNVKHHDGLTDFGVEVVREMNRLGMLVDISHVSDRTFYRTLVVSRAPVIASHSSSRALTNHARNLTDDMLRALARNGGVAMVNYNAAFVSEDYRRAWEAQKPERDQAMEAAREKDKAAGKPLTLEEEVKLEKEWAAKIPRPPFKSLIDHIDHMAKVAGVDHVGLGSDFDGVAALPVGMDSVADLPKITQALVERGYTAEQVQKILGGNLLRVMRACEQTARELQKEKPLGAQPLSGPEVVKPR